MIFRTGISLLVP